jgi:transposase
LPNSDTERQKYALLVGVDGYELLNNIYNDKAVTWLRGIPALQILRRMWIQQFYITADTLKWRSEEEGVPVSAVLINSPYDIDAHYSKQGSSSWVGYKIHLTETCTEDSLNLITNVETTSATTFDGKVTPLVHKNLKKRNMLLQLHLADNGFVD